MPWHENRSEPLLSIVAVARHDTTGRHAIEHVHTFLAGILGQCKRHDVHAEIIIVEWNPLADQPPLAEVLALHQETHPCSVRVIAVHNELHSRYSNTDRLGVLPHVVRNAGIRRARGRFILSTNSNIHFSDEVFGCFNDDWLRPNRLYRCAGRHDVRLGVPTAGPAIEILGYCARHCFRIHTREGAYWPTSDGRRVQFPPPLNDDIADSGLGLQFGLGWHAPERNERTVFRWAEDGCLLLARADCEDSLPLTLAVETGPGLGYRPFHLEIRRQDGLIVSQTHVNRFGLVHIRLPVLSNRENLFSFHVGGGLSAKQDDRRLDFRVLGQIRKQKPSFLNLNLMRRLKCFVQYLTNGLQENDPSLSPRSGFEQPQPLPPSVFDECDMLEAHSYACGDFVLMSRNNWRTLRGFPELGAASPLHDVLLYSLAHHWGIHDELLPEEWPIYRLEGNAMFHPSGEKCSLQLPGANCQIHSINRNQVWSFIKQLKGHSIPYLFNGRNWGLGNEGLHEVDVSESVQHETVR